MHRLSLNMVDIKTRWTEFVALRNKSQAAVTAGIDECGQRLPYPFVCQLLPARDGACAQRA